MKKLITMAAIVVVSTVASPAFAQDSKPFHGPWVGATAGYDVFDAGDGEGEDEGGSEDGFAYGVALGYDYNLGNFVLGVEGEIGDSSVSASDTDVFEDGDELILKAGRDLYAGIRLGVPVNDTLMIYAKGGYTNQRFNLAYTLDDETESDGDNIGGFRLGAGAEFAFGQGFGRLEYRYSDYGSFSDTDLETSRHQIMLTAGMRF
ncbi:outer membrane beta-barrel protein [Qipengyuania sp. YG27]|uniref:Outer membrane beta-barrel protein n=1 Tax=Qipengyuania mesophila TaxID=2867246 RepID=A0ABS7JV95_9SPHN|nr:outer membrane beta-barrel protein [Qipengyuania mesophila]MBX7501581.1 outer membrane beta-barrel protein [Qipengyuania mesophila]